jgi:hypothetical protein
MMYTARRSDRHVPIRTDNRFHMQLPFDYMRRVKNHPIKVGRRRKKLYREPNNAD